MRTRVPLNAIRAFEAAARHSSIVQAAEELCVTPTAVSHQVRILEEFLQVRLFNRRNSSIEMTAEARRVLDKVTGGLDMINDAMRLLADREEHRQMLTIGSSVSLSTMWLMPRLSDFVNAHPAIDVGVRSYLTRREIEGNESDLWISCWQTELDRRIEPLFSEQIVPVCSPQLLEKVRSELQGPQDRAAILRTIPLIHIERPPHATSNNRPSWARYLNEYGVSRSSVAQGVRFNQTSAAVDAAKASLGAMLGRSLLIGDAVARGELVPVAEPFPYLHHYYLVSPWQPHAPDAIREFRDWIVTKAAGGAYGLTLPMPANTPVRQAEDYVVRPRAG